MLHSYVYVNILAQHVHTQNSEDAAQKDVPTTHQYYGHREDQDCFDHFQPPEALDSSRGIGLDMAHHIAKCHTS